MSQILRTNQICPAPPSCRRQVERYLFKVNQLRRHAGGLQRRAQVMRECSNELHGGSVTAYSSGLGKGSRFTICLSRLMEEKELSSPTLGMEGAAAPGKAVKVMVVDDNTDAAQMLAMLFEALGHQVLVEHDPRRALERGRREMPDVFLLDIGWPDMDGNELARRLRAQPETARAVLVAVTGYGQEQDRDSALGAGFDHHFAKPVDISKLTELLAGIDQNSRA